MESQLIKVVGDLTRQRAVGDEIGEERSEMRACSINSNEDRCMLAPSIGL